MYNGIGGCVQELVGGVATPVIVIITMNRLVAMYMY